MKIDASRISLRPFTEDALEKTYEWLHDPEIKDLTWTPDFSKEDQLRWFEKLPQRTDYIAKTIYIDDVMVGAWGIKNINRQEGHAEPYYYIGDKNYWGLGIGDYLMNKSIDVCRELGVSKIVAIMFVKNFRIVNLHFKQGFKILRYENDMYYMEKKI